MMQSELDCTRTQIIEGQTVRRGHTKTFPDTKLCEISGEFFMEHATGCLLNPQKCFFEHCASSPYCLCFDYFMFHLIH
jgi:hypothetical protein